MQQGGGMTESGSFQPGGAWCHLSDLPVYGNSGVNYRDYKQAGCGSRRPVLATLHELHVYVNGGG